jgi:HEAT repeat protein
LTDPMRIMELECRPTTVALSLHEPVFVDFIIRNRSGSIQRIDLGAARAGAFIISIQTVTGVSASELRTERAGFRPSGEVEIAPYADFVERVLMQRWYAFAAEGRYTVLVELALSTGRLAAAPFDVAVLPRDPARLASVCESLTDRALSPGDVEQSDAAAEALAHIEDPIAVPYLQRLLTRAPALGMLAIAGLGRIGDDAARTLLRELSQHDNGEIAAVARRALGGASPGNVMD